MAVNDFTGKNIQDTYQKVVQTDGTNLADGTGSLLPISFRNNDVIISGSLIAQTYVVSESIVNISSGSTVFGDSGDDTHFFSGSITASGNISSSGIITALEGASKGYHIGAGETALDAFGTQLRLGVDTDWTDIVIGKGNAPTKNISLHGPITASGNISSSGTITAANLAGTLTTAHQTDITRLGTLDELSVAGQIAVEGNFAISAATGSFGRLDGGTF